jgi:hypothetical protein
MANEEVLVNCNPILDKPPGRLHFGEAYVGSSIIIKNSTSKLGLTQLVRFLVVKLTYLDSNFRFGMCVVFTINYSFSDSRRLHRQRNVLID